MIDLDDARIMTEPTSGCWIWIGGRAGIAGYGSAWTNGRTQVAHRVLYEQTFGPVPVGFQLDHLCRLPSCVNPRHLEPVTQRENILRGTGPTAVNARQTHCWRGHEFTLANTRMQKRHRHCKECRNIRRRKPRPNRESTGDRP